jgi:hypothetical protein
LLSRNSVAFDSYTARNLAMEASGKALKASWKRWLGTDVTNLIQPFFKDIMN